MYRFTLQMPTPARAVPKAGATTPSSPLCDWQKRKYLSHAPLAVSLGVCVQEAGIESGAVTSTGSLTGDAGIPRCTLTAIANTCLTVSFCKGLVRWRS